MARLLDAIEEKEAKAAAEPKKEKRAAVSKIASHKGKTKGVALRVNPTVYSKFSEINEFYGLSNNSVICMLIAEYVKKKENILLSDNDEDQ